MKTFILLHFLSLYMLSENAVVKYEDYFLNALTDVEPSDFVRRSLNDLYLIGDKLKTHDGEKVSIKLYYESHCPSCRSFESTDFRKVVEDLNKYLTIETFPYGNAEMHKKNGKVTVTCQHGPPECYGNKLHACALDIVKNHTAALLYNSCMTDPSQQKLGSDDAAADNCDKSMGIDANPIKVCAKSKRGDDLLIHYGEESEKVGFNYVPYVLLNGKEYTGDHFVEDVCAAFSNPPPPCTRF